MSSFSRSLLDGSAAPGWFGGRRLLRVVFPLALAAVPAQVRGQTPARAPQPEIAVSPVIVHLTAGDTAQGTTISVRNEGSGEGQLRFYLGDFEQEQDGSFKFLAFGSGAHSCGQRMTAFPDGAVLRPGENQQIQVRLTPGGVCWSMLFVETQPQGRGPIRSVQRVGVKLMSAPAHATAGGEVTTVTVRRAGGDTLAVRAVFQNTGEAPLDLRGRVEIRDYNGKVVAQTEFGPFGSLPGRNRNVDVSLLARLPRGDYLAVPIVDFGGDYLAGGQAAFKVP